jgi:hypothetical protein
MRPPNLRDALKELLEALKQWPTLFIRAGQSQSILQLVHLRVDFVDRSVRVLVSPLFVRHRVIMR